MTVTKNTIIAEILNNDPTQGCVPIFLSTGMHCLGCMASHGETVEEACAVHHRAWPLSAGIHSRHIGRDRSTWLPK